MKAPEYNTIEMLATEHEQAVHVLQSFGIDCTIRPFRTLNEVCESRKIEPELLIECLNVIKQDAVQELIPGSPL